MMQKLDKKTLRPTRVRLIVIPWAILCLALYTSTSGAGSVIREDRMAEWGQLAPKLARISLPQYLGSWLWACVGAGICAVAFAGWGYLLLRRRSFSANLLGGSILQGLAYVASAFVVGQGLLSVAFMALALVGWLRPFCSLLIFLGGVIAGSVSLHSLCTSKSRASLKSLDWPATGQYRVILVLSLLALGLTLLFVPSRISFDASSAYFSDAKLSAMKYGARYFTTFGFTTSVVQSSINYAAMIQIFGDQSARLYSWLAGLSVVLLAMALADRLGVSPTARVVLLALIVTSTSFMDLMGDGKVDLISAAPALAAIYWATDDTNSRRDTNLVVGFLAGMAMTLRPFNLFLMPVILTLPGLLDVLREHRRGTLQAYRDLPKAWLLMALGATPWIIWILISNWALLGDALAVATEYVRLRSGFYPLAFPANAIWTYRLLYPLSVTFINHGQSLGNISPLFVGLLPLALSNYVRSGVRASRTLKVFAAAASLTLILWLIGTSMVFETRYIIFLWILLYMPSALLISSGLQNADRFTRAFVQLAVVFILLFISVRTVYFAIDTYSPIDAQGNPHCYDMDRCVPLQTVNKNAAPGERVLMLNAFRYYLRSDLFACSSTHEEYDKLWALSHRDMEAYWTEAYREGYTYVVYQWDYVVGHLYLGGIPSPGNSPAWLNVQPIYGKPGDQQVVYRLSASKAPVSVERTCKIQHGLWEVKPIAFPGE